MCQAIFYMGHKMLTMEDALVRLGDCHVIVDGPISMAGLSPEMCLCHVDVDETASALRCTVEARGMDVELAPIIGLPEAGETS